jgi:predicted ATPase
MHELDSITVEGFKSIRSIVVKLRAINILIGPNGSGKSNFIGLFAFMNAIREGLLQEYVGKAGGADKILHFGSKNTPEMHLKLSFKGGVNLYELRLKATETDELLLSKERAGFRTQYLMPDSTEHRISWDNIQRVGKEAGISGEVRTAIQKYVKDRLTRWRLYHFHDTSSNSPMKKTNDVNDNHYLRQDGANLAAFLYFLREKHSDSYGLIRRTIQLVTPFFDDFILEPLKLNPNKIILQWRHKESDAFFDASSLSDGTLRFIALSTLFLQPLIHRPSVILVDEPELGLHPYAIAMLASLIRQSSSQTQVIISTQSPLLLDNFDPEEVLVADRVDGATVLTRLESAPLEEWRRNYSLGQLWEKNELGGRPGAN